MLRSRLDNIAASLDEQLDSAIRRAAEMVEDGARDRAPVETGTLRDSIRSEKQSDAAYAVMASAFYAHMVENGTIKTPPRPFLMPAAEAVRDNIDELVRQALKDI